MVCGHKQDLLAYCDQGLADIDLSTLHRMKRKTKRAWVHHLDIARKAFDNERTQVANGQSVITRFLVPLSRLQT